ACAAVCTARPLDVLARELCPLTAFALIELRDSLERDHGELACLGRLASKAIQALRAVVSEVETARPEATGERGGGQENAGQDQHHEHEQLGTHRVLLSHVEGWPLFGVS
ncbi:MAG: hypothetical protein ACD_76C00011G0001, partial [uncultured bacterium]